jgi:hypothetical protein
MKSLVWVLSVIMMISVIVGCSSSKKTTPRVLVFAKYAAWYHKSIPNGIAAIQKLGVENGFIVDTTTSTAYFNEDSLKIIVLLSS